jgi:hypothetical protein
VAASASAGRGVDAARGSAARTAEGARGSGVGAGRALGAATPDVDAGAGRRGVLEALGVGAG